MISSYFCILKAECTKLQCMINVTITPLRKAVPLNHTKGHFHEMGVGCGYHVADTESIWLLLGLCGHCRVYVALNGRSPGISHTTHVVSRQLPTRTIPHCTGIGPDEWVLIVVCSGPSGELS